MAIIGSNSNQSIGNAPLLGASGGGGAGTVQYTISTAAAAESQCQPNTGIVTYIKLIPAVDLNNVVEIDIFVSQHPATVAYNIGLYSNAGALLRSSVMTTTGTGINTSDEFAPIDLDHRNEYWIGLSKKSGGSVSVVCTNTNTGDVIAKAENVGSPYDLPANIGTTSSSNNLFLMRAHGEVPV
jgi:hypothetical protein